MSSFGKICLEPIGFVQTDAIGKEIREKNVVSNIVFCEELTEALEGIKEFSHLFVLFWLHKIEGKERKIMRVRPRGKS